MEKIIYRLTLDTHKSGIQKTLQGFETADKIARRIVVALTSGSDTYDIADNVVAMMYVTTPNATIPSVCSCTIDGNTIIYDVLPIEEAGITYMQLKLIGISEDGAESVLASPKFSVEVEESITDDNAVEQTTEFTALEDAVAKAHGVYNSRLLSVEIEADCTFKAYYADGTVYENGFLKDAVYNGNAIIAESYAKGGTGAREGEDTDNAMYYSNVSRSASLDTIVIADQAKAMLEEAKLLTGITAFMVNFETGELGYTSNDYEFDVNEETGYLEVKGDDAFNPLVYVQEQVEEYLDTKTEELDKIEIKTTKERTIKNTKHGGYRLTKMKANTVQNGTPSPSTPFPLLSTGDCVELVQGAIDSSNGKFYASYLQYLSTKNTIPCNSGDSIGVEISDDRCTNLYAFWYNDSGFMSESKLSSTNKGTFTVPSGATRFHVNGSFSVDITPQTAGKITITINGKYLNVAKTDGGKNISSELWEIGGIDTNNGALINAEQIRIATFDRVEPNESYYVSFPNGNGFVIVYYDENYNFISSNGAMWSSGVFKTPTNARYIKYYLSAQYGTVYKNDVCIEKGTVGTGYTPHGHTVAYFLTQYPMIGGSLIGKENSVVFKDNDGLWKFKSETGIRRYSTSEIVEVSNTYSNVKYFSIPKPTDFVGYDSYWTYTLASNQYQNPPSDAEFDSTKCVGAIMSNAVKSLFWLGMPIGTTLADVQANGDIEIMYPLATPIIETLDTDSQIALNSLETFDGVTYVEFDTRVQPLEFEAEVGTSQVGAYTLKSLNNSENNAVKIEDAINTMLLITP